MAGPHVNRRLLFLVAMAGAGCASPHPLAVTRPNIAPASQAASAPTVGNEAVTIAPIYREFMSVDLPTVMQVAAAQNIDILAAQQRTVANRGRLESTQGAIFPVLSPGATFEHVDGTVRAVQGNLVGVGFDTFQVNAA